MGSQQRIAARGAELRRFWNLEVAENPFRSIALVSSNRRLNALRWAVPDWCAEHVTLEEEARLTLIVRQHKRPQRGSCQYEDSVLHGDQSRRVHRH
jgi:hypothetical protein